MTGDELWVFWALLGLMLALPSLAGSLELLLLTVGAMLPKRTTNRKAPPETQIGRVAVVIPAHNEEQGIAQTVASLHACDVDPAGFEVVVVADNCSDATAARAAAAGARVLERHDPDRRGKGHALDFAFGQLLREDFGGFIVVDADSQVETNLVTEFQRLMSQGAPAVQCPYRIANPEANLRARLLGIAWMAFNVLRPRGRERWRLSVGILGNGFGLTRATLEAVPYLATSVVEDLEYHLRLVASGRRVVFAPNTGVWAEAPTHRDGSASQRARWEGGRLRMLRDWAPRLLVRVLRGERRLSEPLLELLLLPLAFHVLLLLLALLPPFAPTRIYALLGLALVALHVLVAIRVGGGNRRDLLALATAPVYILWKLTLLKAIRGKTRRNAEWVRTQRDHDPGKERKSDDNP